MGIKFTKLLMAVAVAGAIAAPGVASADLYNGYLNTGAAYDGQVGNRPGDVPLNGYDHWKFGSAAFFNMSRGGVQVDPLTPGGVAIGDTIRTVYQAVVSAFTPTGNTPNLNYPGQTGSYEITVAADFLERITDVAAGGTVAVIDANGGGRVSMFYDNNAATFANIANGTGFTDGTLILDASVDRSPPSASRTVYTIIGGEGNGASNLDLSVLYAMLDNGSLGYGLDFIKNILPTDWHITTTVQAGCPDCAQAQTVNFFDNANGYTSVAVNKNFVLLADSNSSLTVPEPETVALLGIGLLGLGLSRRRKLPV